MSFIQQKNECLAKLGKPDKSRKGEVDENAWPLIEAINKTDNYYTTSSCSGRVMLFKESPTGKKWDASWPFASHEEANSEDVWKAIEKIKEGNIWFRYEAPIFHVAAKSIEAAHELIQLCHHKGFRRTGFYSANKKIIVEICSSDDMDVPVFIDNKLLISKEYLIKCVDLANERLKKGWDKMNKLLTLNSNL